MRLEVEAGRGWEIRCPIGAMIKVPHAVVTAEHMASVDDFFSFGATASPS